jgi:peptidoglycan glycosyltransferase
MSSVPVSHRMRQDAIRRPNRRIGPVLAFALVAFVLGALAGAHHGSSSADSLSLRFVRAWSRHEYALMYSLIDAHEQAGISSASFASMYRQADTTATASYLRVLGKPKALAGGVESVPVAVHTRLFGTLRLRFALPVKEETQGTRIGWSHSLEFPGLHPGELLHRQTTLAPRASLLARDGSVLASGPAAARVSPLGAAGSAVIGTTGAIPSERLAALEAQGVPADADVGLSGLELAFEERLHGTPGGILLAGSRTLASTSPHASPAVRTTISPTLQQTAVEALGSHYGGIVAMKPNGEILAVAGIGLDALQPPGSTFKMVTVTGVLQAGIANISSSFPYATYATLDGVKLSNANGEECGGTLALAFAVSCNSVFAPLGVKLGAARLVATAEKFGFNHSPGIPGASESTLPAASQIQGELDIGSTAIGQGQVSASPLEMASVAATVADQGQRPQPTFSPVSANAPRVTVMSPQIAHTVRHLMIDVVREGTGTSAAIPGVTVAGKTGTAELGNSSCQSKPEGESESSAKSSESSPPACSANDPEDTDAWFAAFAPALNPQIVVGVLLVKDGAGGDTAAPVAREVLTAALSSHL